jgi:MYXO-CTERM domain-containing protein
MVGFGAGAYLLSLYDRGTAITPTCGAFASEPANLTDGGVGGVDGAAPAEGGTPGTDAGTRPGADAGSAADSGSPAGDDGGVASEDGGDAGSPTSRGSSSGGCGCRVASRSGSTLALAAIAPLLLLGLRRRRR